MKRTIFFLLIGLIAVSCDMDPFLFNNRKQDKYELPGNNIKESNIEFIKFKSGDFNIYGYWVKSDSANPLTILYCQGNKWSIDNYWDRVMLMHEMGYNVFIYDYKGYGMSEGESSEESIHQDAESALNYVLNVKKINPDSIVIYGYSLGCHPAIYLTSRKFNPVCLITEAPFAAANSLTQGGAGLDLPPLWLTKGEFNNAELIKDIKVPYFLISGDSDDFVRFKDNGRVVFGNAPNPKELYLVAGALHTDIPATMGYDKYKEKIKSWISGKYK